MLKRRKDKRVIKGLTPAQITPTKDTVVITKFRAVGEGKITIKMQSFDKKNWDVLIANKNEGYSNLKMSADDARALAKEILDLL